jgi:hypothetical protein
MSSASDTTTKRKQRVLYADKVIQQTTFDSGLKNHILLEGGRNKSPMTYTPHFYNVVKGALDTTPEEKQSYIDSVVPRPSFTIPDPPTDVFATKGETQATIEFVPPTNNGGSPITSYTVTSNPGGIVASGSSSPIIVTGLTNGIEYTFTVVATNSAGDSVPSLVSNPITPSVTIPVRVVFTSGSGAWVVPTGLTSIDYLLVGGGGGGGAGSGTGAGGGGGGGSVKTGSIVVTPGDVYNYVIGNGGAGGTTLGGGETNGSVGENSIFGEFTALGGGLGYRSRETNETSLFGSGGAAQSGDTPTTGGSGGNVRDGGTNPDQGAGGGGGGAGGAGTTSTSNGSDNNRGGAGGAGVSSTLQDGSTKTYGQGGKGADEGTGSFIGSPGLFVGLPGANAGDNTGNGGGGGASTNAGGNAAAGGSGGSGILVIKYLL